MVEHENKMTPYISIEGLSIGLCYESFEVNLTRLTSKAWKNQAQQGFQFCFSFFQKPGKSGSTRLTRLLTRLLLQGVAGDLEIEKVG